MLSLTRLLVLLCLALLLAAAAQAQPKPRNIQLDITTAPGGATVTGATDAASTGIFNLNFGNLNGLGIGIFTPGLTVQRFANGALYTTPIRLTTKVDWKNQTPRPLSVSIVLDPIAGNAAGRAAAREGASAATLITPSAVTPLVFTTTAADNVPITRYVGIFVSNANGATAVRGTLTARLIYKIFEP
ncbi:MAG: hypothetical protein JOZ52_12740 [Acidobacteria bacterium]|nr:hypothetical protein [Acidobacteriota bacterium]